MSDMEMQPFVESNSLSFCVNLSDKNNGKMCTVYMFEPVIINMLK